MRRKINVVFVAVISFMVVSCSFLDREPTIIVADTFYNSEDEVLYGLAGVYGAINNEALYGNYYSLMISNVDDLSYFNRSTTNNFTQNYSHDASSTEIYEAWTMIYSGIGNANSFMEAVENSEYDPDHKYYNEARFLRAFYHFLLAQAWGDVPLKTEASTSPDDVMCAATSQYEVLKWVVAEMEDCLELADESLENAPSRVVRTTMWGILARVYLFMAGETVSGNEAYRTEYYTKAMQYAGNVISSGKHHLNQSYSQVFINMIEDVYDKEYNESMWEADFMGDRTSSSSWSNGRIGDLIGLQSTAAEGFSEWACNYSYGQYDGSLKLFRLYYSDDRTSGDTDLMTTIPSGTDLTDESVAETYHWDKRQAWNMCPYNYSGNDNYPPYPEVGASGSGSSERSYDKTPYVGRNSSGSTSTTMDPTVAQGIRNAGKWRREVEYEGQMSAKNLYTRINFPILRYADVLLMYAEAYNEVNGGPGAVSTDISTAWGCVLAVRDRAGIETDTGNYTSQEEFRQLVRNERGRELCFEALRKYDLIRWGIFVDAMQDYLTDTQSSWWPSTNDKATYAADIASRVQQKHIVLPIPSIELGVNNLLVQNPLW